MNNIPFFNYPDLFAQHREELIDVFQKVAERAVATIVCVQNITSSPAPMPPAFNNNCMASVALATPNTYLIPVYSDSLCYSRGRRQCQWMLG
jgi:hypothetical protein